MGEDRAAERRFLAQSQYLDLKYSQARAPASAYPGRLARWLLDNVYERPGALLDVGSGRGDHLAAFAELGFDVTGVDISPRSAELAGEFRVEVVDLDSEPLPFAPGSFDHLFSKSVLEHLVNAAPFLSRAREVLRPGGRIAVFTPSWEHTYKRIFYSEYTHVRPFTRQSLGEALTLAGFHDVEVRPFVQLPFVWYRPYLEPLVAAVRALPLRYRPLDDAPWPDGFNKLLRFSKEILLLGTARRDS